jgi:DNA-binding CsgD family transcriptional regulator
MRESETGRVMGTYNQYARPFQLIERIYSAALDGADWHPVVQELGEMFGGACALVVSDPVEGIASLTEAANFDPSYIRSYRDHYGRTNPWVREFLRLPVGSLLYRGLVPELRLEPTEFYNDWLRPQRMRDCIGGILGKIGNTLSYVSVVRLERLGDFTTKDHGLFQMVLGNLQRALRVYGVLARNSALELGLFDALDRAGFAALQVDEHGLLIAHNVLAGELLRSGAVVSVRHGMVAARSSAAEHHLSRAIVVACRTGQGQTIVLPHIGQISRNLLSLVMPLRASDENGEPPLDFSSARCALILVKDPSRSPKPDLAALQKLFGLTDAEARLLQGLASGKSLEAISEQRSVSYGTVRAQLRTVMSKTETTRQGELIALISRRAALNINTSVPYRPFDSDQA